MRQETDEKRFTLKIGLIQFMRLESASPPHRGIISVTLPTDVIRDSFYYQARFDTASLINITEEDTERMCLRLYC